MSTAAWVVIALLAFLVGLAVGRGRAARPYARGERGSVYAVLRAAALAGSPLRGGLSRESARRAVRRLRPLLGARAVALTSTDVPLAWEGPCGQEVLAHVRPALASGRPHVVAGEPLAAVAVPLRVGGRVVGALAAYDAEVGTALVRSAAEAARWISTQLELAELDAARRRAAEAEMRALRAEISPHFIYNALTTIASFVRTDPARARELLLDFADFARYVLRRARDFTTLSEELTCVDRYLLLERARFGDRLRFSVQVSPEVLPVPVPFLCLQPLVENAIKHGMDGRDGGEIRVVACDAGPEAHITVEDDGAGMDPERAGRLLDGDGGGIGLANVDVRLRHIYGERYGLAVETAVGAGTRILLRIPKSAP
ncbi:histidine kinase [Thermoactinospora rubra]|uniref:histidine kinase n=1 Tax=Thermoactinospora rubra TaxID=1088767 RepID=UPI000A10AE12|nr:histidine kinase [Thermoactinospora rubra]